jgi:hypothetical protein
MTTFTMGPRPGAFLASEANGTLSRDPIVIAAGTGTVLPGTVLGRLTANGQYVPLDPGAADGSQTASGVLFDQVTRGTAAVRGVGVVRFAELNGFELVWPSGITAPQRTAAIAQLEQRGLVVR